MKICVVTPYFQENLEWLTQAHASVKSQTVEARHILVCDGATPAQIPDFRGTHIVLQRNYRDYGNTARLIGCYNAVTDNADAIAFLDAESWYYPDHLRSLTALATNTQLDAVASARMLHRSDGTPMMKCPKVDGTNYIDASCMIVFRPAFRHLIAWILQDQNQAAETGQFLWKMLRDSGARMAFMDRPSVAHPTREPMGYDPGRGPVTQGGFGASRDDTSAMALAPVHSWAPTPRVTSEAQASSVPALFRGAVAEHHAALIEPLFMLPALLPNSAWIGHIPFLFALFRMLRPETFVELGVHTGASLIAAASAAAAYQVPTQLVGVDSFMGDQHSGQYDGDNLYNDLRVYFEHTFPSVRLERSLFAEALPRFPRGSIDILHIDGLHTYEAVLEDFTTWFDRMSPAGVILMHDIGVRERGFGVHILWESLKARLPTLEFPHSHGLGVIVLSPDDERLRPLVTLARDEYAMRAYQGLVAEVARVLPERMAARI